MPTRIGSDQWFSTEEVHRLVDAEREACAQVAEDDSLVVWYDDPERPTQVSHCDSLATLERIAAAIRARGEPAQALHCQGGNEAVKPTSG